MSNESADIIRGLRYLRNKDGSSQYGRTQANGTP